MNSNEVKLIVGGCALGKEFLDSPIKDINDINLNETVLKMKLDDANINLDDIKAKDFGMYFNVVNSGKEPYINNLNETQTLKEIIESVGDVLEDSSYDDNIVDQIEKGNLKIIGENNKKYVFNKDDLEKPFYKIIANINKFAVEVDENLPIIQFQIPTLEINPKNIYTRKIITEDKKLIRENTEGNVERKYGRYILKGLNSPKDKDKDKDKEIVKETKTEIVIEVEKEKEIPKYEPYGKRGNKNIRLINKTHKDFEDDKFEKKTTSNNTIYSNYIRNKKPIEKNNLKAKTESELIDDLEKIEKDNVKTFLRKDLLDIYDSVNGEIDNFKKDVFYNNINSFEGKMGEFDKGKMPYSYKRRKVGDLNKGRDKSEDAYKKFVVQTKKYIEEKVDDKNIK